MNRGNIFFEHDERCSGQDFDSFFDVLIKRCIVQSRLEHTELDSEGTKKLNHVYGVLMRAFGTDAEVRINLMPAFISGSVTVKTDIIDLLFIQSSDSSPNSRNDRHRYTVACHLIESVIRTNDGSRLVELLIGEALQAPTLYRHKPANPAVVDDTMAILGGDGKHRLIRLLVPSAVLPDLCFFWRKDSPCVNTHKRVLKQK